MRKLLLSVLNGALFLLFPFIIGCEESQPEVYFQDFVSKRSFNLQEAFGKEFSIIHYNDTIPYSISYDRETEYSHIILNKNEPDTIISAIATTFKEFILLNIPKKNGLLKTFVIQQDDSIINGFTDLWKQNDLLISALTEQPQIIRDSSEFSIVLSHKKRECKKLFRNITEKLKQDTILISEFNMNSDNTDSTAIHPEIQPSDFSSKVYPNPFSNQLNIEMDSEDNYDINLTNTSGQTILNQKCTGNSTQLTNLQSIPAGNYILTITSEKGVSSHKIVKTN
ncbi:MAG: T9SS type A sorting domain-containing protein [Flavobacteriales bacterium]|nr:T9SS type A sorting domain-containing protein [Flavobacteriales bacterium]